MSDQSGFGESLRKFAESTSVRGVGRIFKSDDVVRRVLWILAVAFCLAMLVLQLSRVASQYLRYEFSTVTKEDIWSHTRFPDVTICNVYPFGNMDENSLTWSDYTASMAAKKERWPFERMKSTVSDFTVDDYNNIWLDLSSHLGFAMNLMPNATSQLQASQSQQLIVSCQLFNRDWGETPVNCTSTLRFHWDQSYQRCYTIRIPNDMTEVRLQLEHL